jgi:hypothetical protein
LQRSLRLNENILRYLTLKLSDKADMASRESLPDTDLEVKKEEQVEKKEDSGEQKEEKNGGNE